MGEVKNLFIKHFGYLPDIISTTEHAYISPPSRIISSLMELASFSNKKVLRIIMTDSYAVPPEKCLKQICLPHLLNKNLLTIDINQSQQDILKKFEEDDIKIRNVLSKKSIFSQKEESNYIDIIHSYLKIIKNNKIFDSVAVYNNIIHMYIECFHMGVLNTWLLSSDFVGVDSVKIRRFLKESFEVLSTIDPLKVTLFGKYLESKKRLKIKNIDNIIKIIDWDTYFKELDNISSNCLIVSELILYVYSYCGGFHFGNDHGVINDINSIQNNNNLFQLTLHNKDFRFEIIEKDIQFQQVNMMKNNLNLSQKMYKTIKTLPELYIVLGQDSLRNQFRYYVKNKSNEY